jgi:hypothetical protein
MAPLPYSEIGDVPTALNANIFAYKESPHAYENGAEMKSVFGNEHLVSEIIEDAVPSQ